jgi:hypothetical protein
MHDQRYKTDPDAKMPMLDTHYVQLTYGKNVNARLTFCRTFKHSGIYLQFVNISSRHLINILKNMFFSFKTVTKITSDLCTFL